MKKIPSSAVSSGGWTRYILLAVLVFAAAIVGQVGSYMGQKAGGAVAAAVAVVMLLSAKPDRIRRLLTPVSLAMLAYMLLAGLSTFYARSGKFAIAEFSDMLIAFAVFLAIVLYAQESEDSFRATAGVLAAAAAPVGVLSIDAASADLLMPAFRAVVSLVNSGYGDRTGTNFYSRLSTIFNNPNLYAGFLSIACLLSLWLCLTAKTRGQKLRCTVLLTINVVSYLLAFSMGSLGIFVLAALLMLALCPKEERIGLFLLLFQTAVVALATAAVSVGGFGDTVTGSLRPLLALAGGCVVACLLEVLVRDKLTHALAGRGKLLFGIVLALVVAAVVYLVAALQLTGPFTFGGEGDMRRTADLGPGEYTLTVNATAPVKVRVAYKNEGNLVQNNDTFLADGSSDAPITFTVPADSELVFFTFYGQSGTVIQEALYDGAASGGLKMGYKLLPEFIADRIQDLSANGNVVQRGVYRKDALRLFATSPLLGRGLGGFENGVTSVQDYYYETTHAHNHYVQVLCDLGILGLAAYLALLAAAIWSLVKSRKTKPMLVMALAACVLQMFGQAVTDLTWSVGGCMVLFFAVLGMTALWCGDTLRLEVPKKKASLAVKAPVAGVLGLFVVLIGLNLYAQTAVRGPGATFGTLRLCASIDPFETNDYKLSYLVNRGGDPEVCAKYAADLQKEESNSITLPLAYYYLAEGDCDSALDTLEHGTAYMRADETVWQETFELCEGMLDPVGNVFAMPLLQEPERYLNRVKGLYDALCQVNAQQLDNVELTAENRVFLGKLLAAAATDGDADRTLDIFSTQAIDTRFAPDVDADAAPDYAVVLEGQVEWTGGGAFVARTDCTVALDATLKVAGEYALSVEADGAVSAAVDGTPLEPNGGQRVASDGGNAAVRVSLSVPAGTTVSSVRLAIAE